MTVTTPATDAALAKRINEAWEYRAELGDCDRELRAAPSRFGPGLIVLRSVDRYDRDTVFEGLRALNDVFHTYQGRKAALPPERSRLKSTGWCGSVSRAGWKC